MGTLHLSQHNKRQVEQQFLVVREVLGGRLREVLRLHCVQKHMLHGWNNFSADLTLTYLKGGAPCPISFWPAFACFETQEWEVNFAPEAMTGGQRRRRGRSMRSLGPSRTRESHLPRTAPKHHRTSLFCFSCLSLLVIACNCPKLLLIAPNPLDCS